ncbi:methyltransferase [Streptomyces spiroverticillatus]|uniref:Methyltransferase n=1 Tax=Streptomyces finlayi TaxID=67296 RepID=A0A918X488_9ACTN|nr:class I SAM-dependent methyltransferase [Streptomyces finlayi]GHA27659.1 methyltransferase [Streptomyces spiroverticillatus]GHD08731.1 methyltransferase [Streptomyces finlayi]
MTNDHTRVHDHTQVQEFFGSRAARWDERFPDDGPAFEAAIASLGLRAGSVVLDAGCGTGRALPYLRQAVGSAGTVLGVDLTREMLAEAVRRGRDRGALLVRADVARLPLGTGVLDAVFGSGLVSHLPSPGENVRELARTVRPGGLLALFHPVGRAALAAHQKRQLTDDDLRAEPRLRPLLAASGWRLVSYVDEDDRYLALAVREG